MNGKILLASDELRAEMNKVYPAYNETRVWECVGLLLDAIDESPKPLVTATELMQSTNTGPNIGTEIMRRFDRIDLLISNLAEANNGVRK